MPVSDIYSGNALIQPKSVADFDNEALSAQIKRQGIQQNALELQQGRMKMDEYTRGLQEQGQLRNALSGLGAGATDQQRIDALKATGLPGGFAQADALQKTLIDQEKHRSETSYKGAQTSDLQQKTDHERVKFGLQGLAAANSPQEATMVALKAGLVPQEQAEQYFASIPKDPAGYAQWKQQQMLQGVELSKQFDIKAAQARDAEAQRHNKTTEGIAGAHLNLARSNAAVSMSKPFEVTGPDGTPVLVQQDKQGRIAPVQGFGPKAGASKPLNDSQAKALGFGTRMQEADKLINSLEQKGVSTPSIAKMAVGDMPVLGALANATSSPDQQSVDQAQRDFVNAILRRESGAAISSGEFDNARKQYFSQPGDSTQVKTQKAANRKLAVQGVLAEVPVGQRGTIGPSSEHPADIADLLKKYGK